jgi:hypothetical protein
MGCSSSGRWNYQEKKRTTEECWAVDVTDLPQGTLDRVTSSGFLWAFRLAGRSNVLCLRWTLEPVGEGPVLTLSYRPYRRAEGREIVERVRLLTTKPHFGGTRSWFACPFSSKDGEPCGRRVGKLYLPPRELRFGCRQCHALTYKSSQESHRYDRLCALMAGENSGGSFETLRRIFLFNARRARRRASRAPRGPLEAFDEVSGSGDEPTPP